MDGMNAVEAAHGGDSFLDDLVSTVGLARRSATRNTAISKNVFMNALTVPRT